MGRVMDLRAPSLAALGFATAVAQAVLLRETMAAVAGSELAWGAVLAIWLAGMAAGARVGAGRGGRTLGVAAPTLVLTAALVGAVLLRAGPRVAGVAPGEPALLLEALWVLAAAVLPAAFLGGLGFPLLAGGGGGDAGGAYALEGAGALAGGVLFSLALAPAGSAASLLLALAVTLGVTAWGRRPLAVGAAVLAAAAAVPVQGLLERASWRWAGRDAPLLDWQETRHQRLELAGDGRRALFADGRLVASHPEPYLTAPRAHLLMLLHPAPRRVLAVGALANGMVTTVLRHPVERLDLVEDDPALLLILPRWYGPAIASALDDPRVAVHATDPIRVVAREGPWDLILLLDGDPITLRRSRTRTYEFLSACRERTAPGGVVAILTGIGDTYLAGASGRLLAIQAATLRSAYGQARALPGEGVILAAGKSSGSPVLDLGVLTRRWHERGLDDPVMGPALLEVLLDPGRAGALESRLAALDAPVSTTRRPVAVLAAAAAAEGRGHPGLSSLLGRLLALPTWLLIAGSAAAALTLLLRSLTGAALGLETAAVVGFASMAWWILLLASWQATVGSVYAEIGALTAAFMAGLVAGAALGRRWTAPARALPGLLGVGAALSLVLASGLPLAAPRLAVPLVLVSGGLLTGASFPGAAALCGATVRRGAGRAFAADEAGAAAAALGVGLVALPWAGLGTTSLATAVLGAGAAVALAVRRAGGATD